jgi:hypothetical protein
LFVITYFEKVLYLYLKYYKLIYVNDSDNFLQLKAAHAHSCFFLTAHGQYIQSLWKWVTKNYGIYSKAEKTEFAFQRTLLRGPGRNRPIQAW